MEKVSLSLILVSYSVTYNFFFASIIIYNVNDIMTLMSTCHCALRSRRESLTFPQYLLFFFRKLSRVSSQE